MSAPISFRVFVTRMKHQAKAAGLTEQPTCPFCKAEVAVRDWVTHRRGCQLAQGGR